MSILSLPKVSVILVNFNGARHLANCINSLREINYPTEKVEIVIVDNNSKDDSISILKKDFPEVKILQNKDNYGFAKAVNQGVEIAQGEYVALLNNDMKVEKDWLIELVKPLLNDTELACTGSKVLNWDGTKIDFVLGMMNFEGRGFQIDFEKILKKGEYDTARDMLFVNGGSMLVEREVFIKIGGFDEDYFAFYEDVDFGWRLWIAGYRARFIPTSITYHRHHGTSSSFGQEKLQLLYERNALFSVFKNYSQPVLDKVLSAALLLLNKRAYLSLGVDKDAYRLTNKDDDNKTDINVPKKAISYLLAVDDFIAHLPELRKKREKIQAMRRRSDEALFKLFGEIFFSIFSGKEYQDAQIEVQHSLGIYDVFLKPQRTKVLIITHEVVAEQMAGPGIRCYEIANILSKENEVTLAAPNDNIKKHSLFEVKTYSSGKDLKELAKQTDVIICQGIILAASPFLNEMGKIIIVDIYDPFVLSLLEQHKDLGMEQRFSECKLSLQALRYQLENGDYFMCASEKQKDFWVGMLTALGRVNPQTYDSDVSLKNFIDVVPFGIPQGSPMKSQSVMKGVMNGIKETDKVVLWGGGIYNWFDPLSLIKAFAIIKEKRDDIKLVFMGVKHPNPNVPEMVIATESVELSKELNLYENTVFFNFGWVPYEERANYLAEADIGVSTHFNHIETRFSFRTRMLDYIWAELPMICTQGDSMSKLVKEENLGITVAEKDADLLAEAIIKMATDEKIYADAKSNIASIKNKFTWENAVQPLLEFCRHFEKAADNTTPFKESLLIQNSNQAAVATVNSGNIRKFRHAYHNYGLRTAVRKSISYVKARV